MQFTSEQLAPEQEQGSGVWHMWLRGERCGRAPDDEGMSTGVEGEMMLKGGWVRAGGGCVWQTRVCQVFATAIFIPLVFTEKIRTIEREVPPPFLDFFLGKL